MRQTPRIAWSFVAPIGEFRRLPVITKELTKLENSGGVIQWTASTRVDHCLVWFNAAEAKPSEKFRYKLLLVGFKRNEPYQ